MKHVLYSVQKGNLQFYRLVHTFQHVLWSWKKLPAILCLNSSAVENLFTFAILAVEFYFRFRQNGFAFFSFLFLLLVVRSVVNQANKKKTVVSVWFFLLLPPLSCLLKFKRDRETGGKIRNRLSSSSSPYKTYLLPSIVLPQLHDEEASNSRIYSYSLQSSYYRGNCLIRGGDDGEEKILPTKSPAT